MQLSTLLDPFLEFHIKKALELDIQMLLILIIHL